mgnify:CR=1 FL=1
MRDRLIELKIQLVQNFYCGDCKPSNDKCRKCLTEKEADYLLENGIIVPPCKVGDTVYVITEKRPCYACFYCTDYCHLDCKFDDINKLVVKEATVESIFYSGTAKRIKVEVKGVKNLSRYSLEIGFSKINETLFLSKEDAKKALKECNT